MFNATVAGIDWLRLMRGRHAISYNNLHTGRADTVAVQPLEQIVNAVCMLCT